MPGHKGQGLTSEDHWPRGRTLLKTLLTLASPQPGSPVQSPHQLWIPDPAPSGTGYRRRQGGAGNRDPALQSSPNTDRLHPTPPKQGQLPVAAGTNHPQATGPEPQKRMALQLCRLGSDGSRGSGRGAGGARAGGGSGGVCSFSSWIPGPSPAAQASNDGWSLSTPSPPLLPLSSTFKGPWDDTGPLR